MTRHTRLPATLTALAAVATLTTGCSAGSGASSAGHAPITVFAASSLRAVFDDIEPAVEKSTGAEITITYAGSSDLVAQLEAGAPGDVLATADERQTLNAVRAGVVADGAARVFATNRLTVITPPDDPGHVASLTDLARPDVATVVCAVQVPCGSATRSLFAKAGVTVSPVSEEPQVADVLGKVTSGEADAGLVYITDARSAGAAVRVVDTPQAATTVNTYPISVTRHGEADPARRATAEAFLAAVTGDPGTQVLRQAGFGTPTR